MKLIIKRLLLRIEREVPRRYMFIPLLLGVLLLISIGRVVLLHHEAGQFKSLARERNRCREDRWAASNIERALACGCRVPIELASHFELIQISGVSDAIASRVLDRRTELLERFKATGSAVLSEAERSGIELGLFQEVHGIGAVKARQLAALFTLDQERSCASQ